MLTSQHGKKRPAPHLYRRLHFITQGADMSNTSINVGTRVSFESATGAYCGTVIDILPCITNGRQHATIEVEHELPGILEKVPVDQLKPLSPLQAIVYLTGELNPFPVSPNDRRFLVGQQPKTPGVNHG
jgi:hypothetical protein